VGRSRPKSGILQLRDCWVLYQVGSKTRGNGPLNSLWGSAENSPQPFTGG
jgi:hypothetical protein